MKFSKLFAVFGRSGSKDIQIYTINAVPIATHLTLNTEYWILNTDHDNHNDDALRPESYMQNSILCWRAWREFKFKKTIPNQNPKDQTPCTRSRANCYCIVGVSYVVVKFHSFIHNGNEDRSNSLGLDSVLVWLTRDLFLECFYLLVYID